jgi:hypothetical protein
MNTATFSIEEYAAAILGPGPDGTAATVEPSKVEWLSKRLCGRAQPTLPGYKAGKRWRATQADIDEAIERLRPKRVDFPQVPQVGGMTRTTRRRIAS